MKKEPTLVVPTGDSLPRSEMALLTIVTPDDVNRSIELAHPNLKPYLLAKSV